MSSLPIVAKCLLAWAGFWNLLAFSAMGLDKHRAKTGAWRIPERRLFLQSVEKPGYASGIRRVWVM